MSVSGSRKEGAKKLERTLGLTEALAIGVGTMVGAGIFVFPGIAAGYAGPAAMLSFVLAGAIALLVAFSTSELATAMPKSGGAYFYVSRIFGPMAGFVVGVGQWIGLVFASAFYLTGFAQYAVDLLEELGVDLGNPFVLIAFAVAIILMIVNILGTKGVGKLQNRIVLALTIILSMLFGYGILNAFGLIGETSWPRSFAPKGYWPIFTTTALIFTSYLGFVQIATVAGEIRKPVKNLPRALIGSVLLVMGLYLTALFVSTSVLPTERLAELGETAMVDVARELVGNIGALGILAAGLLATLSSANASILSSSRAVFALSKDDLIPDSISKVNERFGTPHIALLVVGIPIASLTILGRIEVLAEVASLLHLIMYGMICLTLLKIKRTKPWWFTPAFRSPGNKIIPFIGALFSFGLITLMQPLSLYFGAGILVLAIVWYYLFVPKIEFSSPEPSQIVYSLEQAKIIVAVDLEDPKPIPTALVDAFKELELLILGYRLVPEQTSPEQSREEFEEEEQKVLDDIVEKLETQNIKISKELVFTPDLADTMKNYIEQQQSHAVLSTAPIISVERLLVPLYSMEQLSPRWASLLYDLSNSSDLPISLVLLTSSESEAEKERDVEKLKTKAIRYLYRAGVGKEAIRSDKVDVASVAAAVEQLSGEDDVVVLAEPADIDRDSFFKTIHEEIEEAVDSPILVILKEG